MSISLYREDTSFLHRLNPLTKLAFAVVVMVGLTITVNAALSLAVIVLTLLAICALGRIRVPFLLRLVAPVAILSFGLVWTTMIFYVPDPSSPLRTLWAWGPLSVTNQGFAYGLVIMLRTLGFFTTSLLFVLTTDPTDLVQALIQKLRIGYRFGYGAHAAYGFVPLLDSELATIRAAHRVRGVNSSGGLQARWRYFVGLLVPLLAGAVRRAERVALAMDARGFGAYPTRTFYRHSRFGPRDLTFAVGAMVILGAVVWVLNKSG